MSRCKGTLIGQRRRLYILGSRHSGSIGARRGPLYLDLDPLLQAGTCGSPCQLSSYERL